MIFKILSKIKRDGPSATLKTALQVINYRLFKQDWDFDLLPNLMEDLVRKRSSLNIVQIGANVGNTGSDQIYDFLKKWCHDCHEPNLPNCRAILIEPVRHL